MTLAEDLPYDGAITRYFETEAPDDVRAAIAEGGDDPILTPPYPYATPMDKAAYSETMALLQIELAKLQAWVQHSGARVVILFEGRDAAGKGGAIKRIRDHLNPRVVRVAALPTPSETEQTQWYFQRYVAHLPAAGQMVLFDRSWYNRAVVERVFDFCTTAERDRFLLQAPGFERALVQDGVTLIKFWLDVSRAEQLRRFIARERDPLKQWKLSRIDIDGLRLWNAYSVAIAETFAATHTDHAPWTVIRADDKRRSRIATIRKVLSALPYEARGDAAIDPPDPAVCGGPDLWNG